MGKVWLQERWETFLPALSDASEEEIARLCRAELAAWRARGGKLSSLRVPLTDTRNQIRALPLSDANSYLHLRTGKREHLALKYLNFSEEEWRAMDAPSEERLQQRLEQVMLLNEPDAIVAKAAKLLESEKWSEIVVGLALLTGRRLTEVLKAGDFLPCTKYTVIFSGQLKRRDIALKPYEIPTLCEAKLVLEAFTRLRSLKDCSRMDIAEVAVKCGPLVKQAGIEHFSDLIPAREAKSSELYTHLFRSVYNRIAVFYFAPQTIPDLTYIAEIEGHYWEKGRDYAATLHYYDYRIGDGHGTLDGRQGIKLNESSVEVLSVFHPKKEEEQPMTRREQKQAEQRLGAGVGVIEKKVHSILNISQRSRLLFDQVAAESEKKVGQDEVLRTLIKEHYQLKQQNRPDLSEVQALIDELSSQGVERPLAYLKSLIQKDQHFKSGLEKRYSDIDYGSLPLSQLAKMKTPEASNERFRRAVEAIIEHNETTDDDLKRWYINQASILNLVGGRKSVIAEYLAAHQEEIEDHHKKRGITPNFNRKQIGIEEMIHLPEEPA